MGYYEYFAKIAKADAKKACAAAQARAIEAEAKKARRIAIQPQLDEFSNELDQIVARGGSITEINAVGAKIDALIASIN
jgi:membrane protein involved in colicin uptake